MQVESIIGSLIIDLQTEKCLGKITHPIVSYQDQKVLGFVYRKRFYSLPKAFEFQAIKKRYGDFVIIEKDQAGLLLHKRILRKAFKKQREVISLKLVEDDKQVGKVVDFIADDTTGSFKTLIAEKSLFSDIFKIPVSKIQRFDADAFVLKKDAIPKEEKEKPGLFTRVLTGAATKIGSATRQSKQFYKKGQKNMLLGQISPCDIINSNNEVLLKKGQTITEELLETLLAHDKLGELGAAVVGSGIGTKYKMYKEKKKKKSLSQSEKDK